MANRLQVTCINKSDSSNPDEQILNIGGQDAGAQWKISQEEAVNRIEAGTSEFFINVLRQEVNLVVAVSKSGNKYIKTEGDGEQNNLLSLSECA